LGPERGFLVYLYTLYTAYILHRGASVARKFALKYPVALLARNPSNYEPLVKEIEAAGGKAIGISTDCADGASVKKAFETLKKEMAGAKLTAAVYNVGGRFVRKPFMELSEEDFVAGFEANGYASCCA
jgi:short-subunit dehydrogenase